MLRLSENRPVSEVAHALAAAFKEGGLNGARLGVVGTTEDAGTRDHGSMGHGSARVKLDDLLE